MKHLCALFFIISLSLSSAQIPTNDSSVVPDSATLDRIWQQWRAEYKPEHAAEVAGNTTIGGWNEAAARRCVCMSVLSKLLLFVLLLPIHSNIVWFVAQAAAVLVRGLLLGGVAAGLELQILQRPRCWLHRGHGRQRCQ